MLHYETVDESTLELLKKLQSLRMFSEMRLVGGTSLPNCQPISGQDTTDYYLLPNTYYLKLMLHPIPLHHLPKRQ